MFSSHFIFVEKEVDKLLKKAYFQKLFHIEKEETFNEDEEIDPQDDPSFEWMLWYALSFFLFGIEKRDSFALYKINFPVLGEENFKNCEPFQVQLRQKFSNSLKKCQLDKSLEDLPAEFLTCNEIQKFQVEYFRLLILEKLVEIYQELGKETPIHIKLAWEKAKLSFSEIEMDFLFRMRRHFNGTLCEDCSLDEEGKVLVMKGR